MTPWLTILVLFGVTARGGDPQSATVEPPKLGQPADFSQIVGALQIATRAFPTTVALEEPTTLTVTITGQAFFPYVPKRSSLRIFPAGMDRDFYVESVSEKNLDGAWEFVFHLRPKHERVTLIPGLKLVYYAPRQRRFQTAYSDAIPLAVTPRTAPKDAVPPLHVVSAPASFLELVSEPPTRFWFIPAWGIVAILVAIPGSCIAAIVWLGRRGGMTEEKRRRLVVETLSAMEHAADAETLCKVIGAYLRESLGLPVQEPTPAELDRWLKRRGVARPIRQRCRQVLAACAAVRFGPERKSDPELTSSCADMVHLLEEQACLGAR
jgi:hypothetical protein